jgi:hypothetical protein
MQLLWTGLDNCQQCRIGGLCGVSGVQGKAWQLIGGQAIGYRLEQERLVGSTGTAAERRRAAPLHRQALKQPAYRHARRTRP